MITNVNVSPLSYSATKTLALASVTVDNAVVIKSIQIKQNENGELYLQMPQKMKIDKNYPDKKQYDDIAFPITKEAHEELNSKVFEKFANPDVNIDLFDSPQTQQQPPQIDVNIAKYSRPKRDGQIGAGTLTINDSFVIKDVRVYQAIDGSMYYKLPQYKSLSGNDKSIVSPVSKDMHKNIGKIIEAEMKIDYSYRLVDNETFKKMRDACPDLFKQCSSSEDKNVKIKFDSANKEQINEMLVKLSSKQSPDKQQTEAKRTKPKSTKSKTTKSQAVPKPIR